MVTILICVDQAEGRAWAAQHAYRPRDLVMVTPRSPDACRGHNAEAVYATPAARSLVLFAALVERARPCVATRPSADRVC